MLQLAPKKGNKANLAALRPKPEVIRITSLLGVETASVDPYFLERFAPTAGGSLGRDCLPPFTSATAACVVYDFAFLQEKVSLIL